MFEMLESPNHLLDAVTELHRLAKHAHCPKQSATTRNRARGVVPRSLYVRLRRDVRVSIRHPQKVSLRNLFSAMARDCHLHNIMMLNNPENRNRRFAP